MVTTGSKHLNRAARRDALRLIIGGITKHFPTTTPLVLDGVSILPADLMKLLQSVIDQLDESSSAEASWHTASKSATDGLAKAHPLVLALKRVVINQFGGNAETLGDFGFPPPKARKTTVAVKDAAAKKAKATKVAKKPIATQTTKQLPPG